MQYLYKIILLFCCVIFLATTISAQVDSVSHTTMSQKDSVAAEKAASKQKEKEEKEAIKLREAEAKRLQKEKDLKEDSINRLNPKYRRPGTAAFRSAVLPGWGQVYNKKIWKVPIVWAGLGVTGGIFADNFVWYRRFRDAAIVGKSIMDRNDSTGYNKLNGQIKTWYFGDNGVQYERLRSDRDQYRKDRDYSALFFILAWALNVVDATVDAHLSTFDVSPNLTFKIEPGYSELGKTSGLSFVLKIK